MNQPIPENANSNCPGLKSQEAGKKQACQGCPNQSQCASGTIQIDPAIIAIQKKFQSIKHVILVLSGKGGVGKSTVATQLALCLSQKYEVGLLDIDICGPSVPTILGMVGQQVHQSAQGWSPVYHGDLAVMSIGFLINNPNDAVIWRGPRKNGLIKQFLQQVNWGELDYLIIDTPPGTSDEHLSLVQYVQCRASDGAVIVTTPQEVALADVRKEINFCRKTNVPILGVVQNMSGFVCPNCKCEAALFNATSGGAAKMCVDFECKLLAKIPLDPKIQALLDRGESIFETDEEFQSQSVVIQEYKKLAEYLSSGFQNK